VDAGEVDDLIELVGDLRLRHAQDRPVEVDVLAPGQLGVEARAQLKQGRERTRGDDLAVVRHEDPRDALEQGGLARAVLADEPEGRALGNLEGDVLQRPELIEGCAPASHDGGLE